MLPPALSRSELNSVSNHDDAQQCGPVSSPGRSFPPPLCLYDGFARGADEGVRPYTSEIFARRRV
jgi:hypothetical protein